jgi:type II secretory pathway predicted ATPase ExeA
MYEAFFGVRQRPFELTPNPRFLVPTRSHGEALANLEYGISSRKGITLLIGEAGTGKTTLIRTALERQQTRTHCIELQNPALTRDEFIEMLAVRFGLSERARTSKAACLLELEALLHDRQAQSAPETTVLVVDEAQSLPFDLLEEIRLLANIETSDEKLLSVILAGQPELAERLNAPSLRQFKQRIALRCTLQPLGVQETAGYLAGRIRAAGGAAAQVFTQEAVAAIHEHSHGIPRAINVLADNALLTAFALQKRPVTRQIVLDVSRDFELGDVIPQIAEGAIAPEVATKQPAPSRLLKSEPATATATAETLTPATPTLTKLTPASLTSETKRTPAAVETAPIPAVAAAAAVATPAMPPEERTDSETQATGSRPELFSTVIKRRRFSFF